MPYNPKKLAVLSALKKLEKKVKTVQLQELMTALGDQFSERSVRRWLAEGVVEGQVEKIGQKRATGYRTVEQNKIIASSLSDEKQFSFTPQADAVLEKIKKPVLQRQSVIYNKSWIDSYRPNHTFYLTLDQRNALKAIERPESDATPAGTYARKIYDRLLVELSYNSSRLEGNTYSFGETEKLLLEGIDSSGKLDAEKVMILNHKEAIRYLVDNAEKLEINFNAICTLHYLLSDGLVSSKESGKIRDNSVRIGSSVYLPMDGQVRLTEQLNHICYLAEKINDPHEQSFFLLLHIAYLQAFIDVNKRTSRLAANIPLILHNLHPIAFNKIAKDDYISAMIAVYELNDVRALAELYTFSCLYTAREYNLLIESMGFNEARIRFRTELRGMLREIILKKLTRKHLQYYIESYVLSNIPKAFQVECMNLIREDLKNMGPERIVGLGISRQELEEWRQLK